jgi:hypothetical protein
VGAVVTTSVVVVLVVVTGTGCSTTQLASISATINEIRMFGFITFDSLNHSFAKAYPALLKQGLRPQYSNGIAKMGFPAMME